MNIYLTVSEEIPTYNSEIAYCIAELVNAKSNSQARYLAWKNDGNYCKYDIREMPRFKTECKIKDSGIVDPKLVSEFYNEEGDNHMWIFKKEKVKAGIPSI